MKKIVIHCASGLRNTGDEAILDVLLSELGEIGDITVISLDARYSSGMHPGARFIDNKDPSWKEAVRECDLFLLGGGGLLQDKTTCFNVGRWLRKLDYAQKCGKKTMVYANSLEPLQYSFNRQAVSRSLARADAVTVRDPLSLAVAQDLGIRQAVLTADPVFSHQVGWAGISEENLPAAYAVMTVRHWFDTHPLIPVKVCSRLGIRSRHNRKNYAVYIERLARLADYISQEQKLPIVWLSCCPGRDEKVARDVIERLDGRGEHRIVSDER